MKILVVSQYFYPETFRINDFCFKLVEEGNDVTVLTGYPNYPEGYFYPEYKNKRIKKENIHGVNVIRVNMSQRRKNAIALFFNYFTYAISAGLKALRLERDFDIIFVYEVSPVTQIIPAWLYKLLNKTPIVVNCQDIWPDVIKVYGIKENSFIFSLVRMFSKWLYRRADVIVTSSPGFNQYLANVCGIANEKMVYMPNFAENFYLDFGNSKCDDGKKHLLFAGNIGKAQNLDVIVNAVALLDPILQKEIMIDILGDGSYLNEMKKMVEERKLEKYFTFHGRKPSDQLKSYYEGADGFLLTLEGNSPVSQTIPAKLQGYMGAGKPIFAAINGEANELIRLANCGRCVPAGDVNGMVQIITEMLQTDDLMAKEGFNGRQYFLENFTIAKYIEKLTQLFEVLQMRR